MDHQDAVSFLKNAVVATLPEQWADLGCGSGTFTRALIDLLPDGSHVTAVDQEQQRLYMAGVAFVKANFEKDDLPLSGLDGILLANSIHYVADKEKLVSRLEPMFSGKPRFIVIEYDSDRANPWVPYPLSFAKLQTLFESLGYSHVVKVGEKPSAYNSNLMYCALIS